MLHQFDLSSGVHRRGTATRGLRDDRGIANDATWGPVVRVVLTACRLSLVGADLDGTSFLGAYPTATRRVEPARKTRKACGWPQGVRWALAALGSGRLEVTQGRSAVARRRLAK